VIIVIERFTEINDNCKHQFADLDLNFLFLEADELSLTTMFDLNPCC